MYQLHKFEYQFLIRIYLVYSNELHGERSVVLLTAFRTTLRQILALVASTLAGPVGSRLLKLNFLRLLTSSEVTAVPQAPGWSKPNVLSDRRATLGCPAYSNLDVPVLGSLGLSYSPLRASFPPLRTVTKHSGDLTCNH